WWLAVSTWFKGSYLWVAFLFSYPTLLPYTPLWRPSPIFPRDSRLHLRVRGGWWRYWMWRMRCGMPLDRSHYQCTQQGGGGMCDSRMLHSDMSRAALFLKT